MNGKAYLLLADGLLVEGKAIGKKGTSGGEICFNTGMTGYQEIYTDPSYHGQIVVNTSAHIGNYGTVVEDNESGSPKIQGIVINEFSKEFSRKTAKESLQTYLEKHGVVGIADIDTRKLVRHIRSKGAMNAIISSELTPEQLKEELKKVPSMDGLELFKIAALDVGIKNNIVKCLAERGCYVQVFPAKTTYQEMEVWKPNGYFISNGPGDPSVMDYAIKTVKDILDADRPVFGICLGHQLLALAAGLTTFKKKFNFRFGRDDISKSRLCCK